MNAPDVSVIVAAWKAAAFLERAVASALASQNLNVEVIVVDDASPDDTFAVAQRLAASDPRVVAVRLPANVGPSAARNRAIGLARGTYIAVLDADDAMKPDRLERLVALAERKGADIAVDNMAEVDEAYRPIGDGKFLKSPRFSEARAIDLETWIAFNEPMKAGDCIGYLKPVMRRATLETLDARYDPTLRNSEDYYFVAHLLAAGARMSYTPEAGYLYTRAAGSTSHRLRPDQTKAWLVAEDAFQKRREAVFSAPVRQALARRNRALRNVDQMVAATHALKARKVGAFVKLLVSDPAAAGFTLKTFAGVAMGRVFGRKSASR